MRLSEIAGFRLRGFRVPLTLVLIGSMAGCASAIFQQPQVSLENVRLAGLGLRGGTLLFNLRVTNPNPFALSANRLDYDLVIADSRAPGDTTWLDLASGTYSERFSVGGGDTEIVEVPVEFTYRGLGSAAASVLRAGALNYRASGNIDVRTPVGSYEIPFQRGGLVSVLGSP